MYALMLLVPLVAVLALVANLFRHMGRTTPAGIGLRGRLALFRLRMQLLPDLGVVTLADAALGTVDDIDLAVINEFRKSSWLLENLPFDDAVNPAGGGATLTYGYTRQATQRTAGFRAINAEYTPGEVTRDRHTVDLKPLGGSFQVDRVLAKLGPAAATEIVVQMDALIQASQAKFTDAVINGDSAVDANGFDGLDKALTGSSTEIGADTSADWTTSLDSPANGFKVLKVVDDFLAVMDGAPTAVFANRAAIAYLVALARQVNQYTENVLTFDGQGAGAGGGVVRRYGNLVLVDPGTKPGSNVDIIPVEDRDVDNTVYTIAVTGSPAGGSFSLTVTIDGDTQETAAIAFNADAAAVQAALIALSNVPPGGVTVSGTTTKTITFTGLLTDVIAVLALEDNNLTGGTSPSVTVTEVATTANTTGVTDIYAVRIGMSGFHGVTVANQPLLQKWMPDFTTAGAVKTGEVELGPVAVALKATKSAAVLRNVKVR